MVRIHNEYLGGTEVMKKVQRSENLYCYVEDGNIAYRAVLTPSQIVQLIDEGVERVSIYISNESYSVIDVIKNKQDGNYYFDVKLESRGL